MCILMGKRLAVFLNSFLLLQSFFLVKDVKIDFLKEKMVLRVVFFFFFFFFFFFYIKLTFRWLETGLSDLKNTKQLKCCLW